LTLDRKKILYLALDRYPISPTVRGDFQMSCVYIFMPTCGFVECFATSVAVLVMDIYQFFAGCLPGLLAKYSLSALAPLPLPQPSTRFKESQHFLIFIHEVVYYVIFFEIVVCCLVNPSLYIFSSFCFAPAD